MSCRRKIYLITQDIKSCWERTKEYLLRAYYASEWVYYSLKYTLHVTVCGVTFMANCIRKIRDRSENEKSLIWIRRTPDISFHGGCAIFIQSKPGRTFPPCGSWRCGSLEFTSVLTNDYAQLIWHRVKDVTVGMILKNWRRNSTSISYSFCILHLMTSL